MQVYRVLAPPPFSTAVQVYRGGDLYEGQFVNDEREGEGRCAFAMGTVYTGQWHQGARHGEGREVTPANDRYEGQWERGRMHGSGKLEYGSGAVYVGTWQARPRGDVWEMYGRCREM